MKSVMAVQVGLVRTARSVLRRRRRMRVKHAAGGYRCRCCSDVGARGSREVPGRKGRVERERLQVHVGAVQTEQVPIHGRQHVAIIQLRSRGAIREALKQTRAPGRPHRKWRLNRHGMVAIFTWKRYSNMWYDICTSL